MLAFSAVSIQELGGIANEVRELLRHLKNLSQLFFDPHRFQTVHFRHQVVLEGGHGPKPLAKVVHVHLAVFGHEFPHPDALPRGTVFVAGSDPFGRRSELLALVAVHDLVPRHDQMRSVGEMEIVTRNASRRESLNLAKEPLRTDHHPCSDHIRDLVIQYPRRNQMERIGNPFPHDRVTRVVAAVVAHNTIKAAVLHERVDRRHAQVHGTRDAATECAELMDTLRAQHQQLGATLQRAMLENTYREMCNEPDADSAENLVRWGEG